MKIISWNVQGLGGSRCMRLKPRCSRDLRYAASTLFKVPDLVFIQEHHLSERRISSYGSLFSSSFDMLWSAAIGGNEVRAGTTILVNRTFASNVLNHIVVIPGRVQFLKILYHGLHLGFLNVYAHNSSIERADLWMRLLNYVNDSVACQDVDAWCVVGDFNMIETIDDTSSLVMQPLHGRELGVWEKLCFKLNILDVWLLPNFRTLPDSLKFSRTNRNIVNPILSRIDRIYMSASLFRFGGNVSIVPGTTFSDHFPLLCQLNIGIKNVSNRIAIPKFLFTKDEYKDSITTIWQQDHGNDPASMLESNLRNVSVFFKEQAILHKKGTWQNWRNLRASILSLQRLQHSNPHSIDLACRLKAASEELQRLQHEKDKYDFLNKTSKWLKVGDRCTKEFFNVKGPKFTKARMEVLRKEDGTLVQEPNEILQMASNFYQSLLTAQSFSEQDIQCRERVLQTVPKLVTEQIASDLMLPIDEIEILKALHDLRDDSCPGSDLLTPTFFTYHWPLVGKLIIDAFNQMFFSASVPSEFLEGLIFLIPKKQTHLEDITSWRPITLLNTIYKLYAKVIANRLQLHLSSLIQMSQSGFVKGRNIFYNIFIFWEAIGMAKQQQFDLAILLLDFEKAYDRVDWQFLHEVLLALGFPLQWILAIESLYRNAKSRVLINGQFGTLFPISRSVRQGCPLAPYLFLFYADAMVHFLRNESNNIKGLKMSSSTTPLTDAEFADDTAMFLHASVDNLNRLEDALQVFCNATGSKLNWNKSVGFWVGEAEPIWKPNPHFRWIPKGEAYTYLGCQVGVDLKPELQIVPLLSKLRRKIIFWSSAKLSLAARILIVNQVLLATMWYSCSAWIFSRSALTLVQRMVRNFLWSGSDRERVRAKVSWSTIILPKQFGGLGILDPIIQSKALLAKFFVRVWLPGQETWKKMCKWHLSLGVPSKGGPWVSSERWFLEEDLKLKGSNLTMISFSLRFLMHE